MPARQSAQPLAPLASHPATLPPATLLFTSTVTTAAPAPQGTAVAVGAASNFPTHLPDACLRDGFLDTAALYPA